MVPLLENYFTQVILTSFAHERAASVDDLDKFSTHSNTQKIDNWETFMKQIISEPFYNSKVVFVVGSLELVGRISRFLNEKALPTSD
ncbi:hypothetical protein JCM21714_1642 [Gracilibacillus boraciitolerans JCM 21714]|uniref:Dihydrofolate synthase n=1 Tax=Gracilibacillus boraciitolerans JCM 21714 TaxID=1298598 RepID=W4VIP8_9BACI|nr:hypothetical protein [Gracilibacillus boraciitolerans]GAE92634.1 hypothetical protein JCM21714_1642 [Gracilibacillus boraciitolerans JCM 21714]